MFFIYEFDKFVHFDLTIKMKVDPLEFGFENITLNIAHQFSGK